MGNKSLALLQEQTAELRQGLNDASLSYLFAQLIPYPITWDVTDQTICEKNDRHFQNLLKSNQDYLNHLLSTKECIALFNASTSEISRKNTNSKLNNALLQEIIQLGNQLAPPSSESATTIQATFYQFASASKALVKGNDSQLVRTMIAIFEKLHLNVLSERIQLCHSLLYSLHPTTTTIPTLDVSTLPSGVQNDLETKFHALYSITLRSYIATKCFQDLTHIPPKLPTLSTTTATTSEGISSNILTHSHIFLLSFTHSKMLLYDGAQTWDQLYSNTRNGTNFNTMCDTMIGYDGPTIIVIRDTNNFTFGLLSRNRWEMCDTFFGTNVDTELFQLMPQLKLLSSQKRRGCQNHFNYMNTKEYRLHLPHGLGMGGDLDYFRFLIQPTFKNCISRASGLTFELGQIASSETFDIETIEIYGCGGDQAAMVRQERKEEEKRFIEGRRKVDKAQLMDGFTQEYLLGNTFKHKSEQQGREGENRT